MCDACGEEVEEENEGDSVLRFTVRGEEREMDICGECLGGTFLQEARPVNNRRRRKKATGFSCEKCGKDYVRERNRDKHQETCEG
jgi:hypothetical protein